MADANDFKAGDLEYDLLRKILGRLSSSSGGSGTLSTDVTLGGAGASNSLYPSQLAAKTYIDLADAAVAAAASAALTAGLAGKQNSLGYTAENSANKDVDGTLASNSDVKYPSQKATKTYADAVAATAAAALTAGLATKQNSLGFTAENVANKDTDGTLTANSDTKYASQKATKTYADAVAATASAALTAGLALKQNLFSASTLTYAATTNIDFSLADYRTVTLTGNITFTTSNLAAAKAITVRIVGDSSSRTLTFPAGWIFIGAAAPTALAANKTAVLSLTSFSTTDANVIAAYSVQP